jgi:hypothetical protein
MRSGKSPQALKPLWFMRDVGVAETVSFQIVECEVLHA